MPLKQREGAVSMAGSFRESNVDDEQSWPYRTTQFIENKEGKSHPLLDAIREAKKSSDKRSWVEKMKRLVRDYLDSERCKVDEQMMFKYFDGVMSEESKRQRNKTYIEIDDMVTDLHSRGYRIVKHSAITPKGDFSEVESPKTLDINASPSASSLFYEVDFDVVEFRGVYDFLGRYQNNFPNYFKNDKDYFEYTQTHDIWIVESIETGVPIAFSTFCLVDDKADRELYDAEDGQILLYHDTVALDADLQGQGLGMLIADIMDGYYLQTLGEDIQYGLCTGWINTNDKGLISKGFHEKRGFGNWKEGEAPLSKWVNRYNELNAEYRDKVPVKPVKPMTKVKTGGR